MLSIVRETFQERFDKYMSDPASARQFMQERLKTMPPAELAYLLAEHDKFHRIGCKEYEDCESGNDPLGRYVDPWGRPVQGHDEDSTYTVSEEMFQVSDSKDV